MEQDTTQTPPTAPPPAGPDNDLGTELGRRPRGGPSTLTMVLAAAVIAVLGFAGGILVGKGMDDPQQVAFPGGGQFPGQGGGQFPGQGGGQFPGQGGGQFPGQGGAFPGADAMFGTITAVAGDSITLETANGEVITVRIGDETAIQVTDQGSIADLAEGDTVVVAGDRQGETVDADTINEAAGLGIPGA